jgi:D-tyrosyl-tRNA(Tyr) deacylase
MIAVAQRVSAASVTAAAATAGQIGPGLLVLLGVAQGDAPEDAAYIARKLANLRVFEQDGKMTQSVRDIGGSILVVSQFTLLGDVRHGNRPDFMRAAAPDDAKALIDGCVEALREMGLPVQTGVFGAHMEVSSVNDGPVTILLDSKRGL